jgi:hypothetical protein
MAGLGPAIDVFVEISLSSYARSRRVIAAHLIWQLRRYEAIHPFEMRANSL